MFVGRASGDYYCFSRGVWGWAPGSVSTMVVVVRERRQVLIETLKHPQHLTQKAQNTSELYYRWSESPSLHTSSSLTPLNLSLTLFPPALTTRPVLHLLLLKPCHQFRPSSSLRSERFARTFCTQVSCHPNLSLSLSFSPFALRPLFHTHTQSSG